MKHRIHPDAESAARRVSQNRAPPRPAHGSATQDRAGLALAPALSAERFTFDGLSCYVAGKGPPLLLVHSVNPAASAAEVRPLFDHYRATRTVFALDLPGFRFSDRSDRA